MIGVRLHTTDADGKMRPTSKGISMDVARLDELHTMVTRATRRARALGLIDGDEAAGSDHGGSE